MSRDDAIGFALLVAILFVTIFVGLVVFKLLFEFFWLRLVVGVGLLWLLWTSVTPENEPIIWIATVLIGLGILSPWAIVILTGGAIIGYLLTRNRN